MTSRSGATRHWFDRTLHARRRPALLLRAKAVSSLRRFFEARGVLEVETPALQASPGLEPHLSAFATELAEPFETGRSTLYLHTSPEFAMKKLLCAGESDIFQLARVFRNEERSDTHHPEFTMLEWYRSGFSLSDLMDETEALVQAVARDVGVDTLTWNGHRVDPHQPWERLSAAGAFARIGLDLNAALEAGVRLSGRPMEPDPRPLAAAARDRGLALNSAEHDRFDDVFFRIFLEHIEPALGCERPTLLYGYPLCMAALSRPSQAEPGTCERFELYVGGLELANAFGELQDPQEHVRRFTADMDVREALYGTRYPIDGDFIAALEQGLPECSGIALGFDRLVMLLAGAATIDDVLWVPVCANPT
ncbi:EF-P lysine aminoacylase GenX [Phaeovibrio sulfidiphilus]|uniref:EF-P lysine aminoacylase GenX n=1 Tax=Phaeovibrio sulfidiphilus TaxID=1220600 RepID=A0A8J7CC92_9PROT|nr:EF-P lysine aminoacylase EpmA [Phaeovibrio sulfidiphilus]MBE1237023.1 EF-P lysine aminoacylase GenX [Phaeovibrio sulfidiphilus]